jgi:hypothetical protein
VEEHDAMPEKGPSDSLPDAPWGIISIKPQVSIHCRQYDTSANSGAVGRLLSNIIIKLLLHNMHLRIHD